MVRACLLLALLLLCAAGGASAAEPTTFRSIELDGTTLKVTLNDGGVVWREALVGAVLTLGRDVKLRIDHLEVDAQDPAGEIVLHQFSVQPPGTELWGNPCPPGPDGRRLGLMMAGTWDQQGRLKSFEGRSIACTATPQAKCVRFGYKPWKAAADGTSLADVHRACVHALRGDYCGEGRSTLPEGAMLDVYDAVGILKPEQRPLLAFEAAWGAEGALCVHHSRNPDAMPLETLGAQCPRLKDRLGAMCTAEAAPALGRALLFNKSIPR